jgi:hypothetical protein
LIGNALARTQQPSPANKTPASTVACIHLFLQRRASSEWVDSLEEAYRQLKPEAALAIVELVQRLDGDSTIIANARQHTAALFAAAQTPEGFFDLSLYTPGGDIVGPPSTTPRPGAIRHDQEMYDLIHTLDTIDFLRRVNLPLRDQAALVRWIQAAQTPEGRFATEERYNQLFVERHPVDELLADAEEGFPIEYHHPLITGTRPYNEIEETAHAVRALRLLDAQPRDVAACVAWLQGWQQPDGSFFGPHHPDVMALRNDGYDLDTAPADELDDYYLGNPRLDDTYWAVLALDALGARPRDVAGCRAWLQDALLSPNFGHQNRLAALAARRILAWERVEALYLLEEHLRDEAKWIAIGRSRREGGILKVWWESSQVVDTVLSWDDLVDTERSFHILGVMGGLDSAFLATFK